MTRTAKILASLLSACAGLVSTVSSAYAATTVTVTADKDSGRYDAPFSVTLTASDPKAKIWYVFDPKAPPGDALPYSKPIRIEKSTPLLFFAYVDLKNESKIERRDYVVLVTTLRISADTEIAHDAKTVPITIRNYGTSSASLIGWTLRTGLESKTFAVGSVAPNASATFELPYSEGAVTLSSPDGEIRSTANVVRKEAEIAIAPPVTKPEPPATAEKPPKPVPSATETPVGTSAGESPAPSETTVPPSVTEIPAPAPSAETPAPAGIPETPEEVASVTEKMPDAAVPEKPIDSPIEIKASAIESTGGSEAGKRAVFAALAILVAGAVVRIASITKKRRG